MCKVIDNSTFIGLLAECLQLFRVASITCLQLEILVTSHLLGWKDNHSHLAQFFAKVKTNDMYYKLIGMYACMVE